MTTRTFTNIETLHLLLIVIHVVGSNVLQKLDIIIRMETGHIVLRSTRRTINLHLSVKTVVDEQVVGHSYAVGLHWVAYQRFYKTVTLKLLGFNTELQRGIISRFLDIIMTSF